ncbi:hypothetical protein [Brumimicrobium aurantiacum]|uniref:Outer membrane protein beta-barrel domain-containing protein n=1 Tax=Brumimicrobium aurantiacum TaxID=1737063 RepID=A0A3E1EVP2_9FLAO|nr:hypothetical protein [Brumimicrobium aurantiacum]RFC53636.1 hypothetical protein DXU93_12815 [Brumimicrobium aurantiacum]
MKMKNNQLFIIPVFLISLLCSFTIHAQRDVEEAISTPYISIQYGANWTGGDLADRYGFTNSLGSHAGYKTKNNWIYGIDGNFFFGNDVKIDGLVQNLMDEQNQIMNTSGTPAKVLLFNRGFNINFAVSKIFPVLSPNKNSGIMLQLSAGYLWHKLRLETQEDEVPQLENEYLKGYDRLTTGVNTSEFIGYSFMADRGIYNFYAGFYFQQGFTKNQRDIFWDHPNERASKDLRIEHMYGFKVGWLIPIYKRQVKDYYFN